MPRVTCLVPGCPTKASVLEKLLSVPRNDDLRALWMRYLLPIDPTLRSQTKAQLIHYKICTRHFEAKYICNKKRVFNGVPTLFTEEEIKSGIPTKPLVLPDNKLKKLYEEHSYSYMRPHVDHSYCVDTEIETTDNYDIPDERETEAVWPGDAYADFPGDLDADKSAGDTSIGLLIGLSHRYERTKTPERITKSKDCRKIIKPQTQLTHSKPLKSNLIQQYMNEFINEIQDDIHSPPPLEDPEGTKEEFANELQTYNFSSKVINTNKELKPHDSMEHLMYAEKAYAAITFCLLKQRESLEESIRELLTWATNAVYDYESLEEKVTDLFKNGEFITISLRILQIVCKYRVKNIEMRKDSIVNQVLKPSLKESMSNIRHSHTHLFDEEALRSALNSADKENIHNQSLEASMTESLRNTLQTTTHTSDQESQKSAQISSASIHKMFVPKKTKTKRDRGVQANIIPKKSDKNVQVKPKKVRKAGKAVQVNSNDLESIAPGRKVKKTDAGSQTTEKDKLLGATMLFNNNPPLQERSEINDSPLNHCQKIQYVVNIKRKKPLHTDETKNLGKNSLEPNPQGGPEFTDYPHSQHVQSIPKSKELATNTRHSQSSQHGSKKKRKTTTSAPDPSMPVLWDACQNLLSLSGESRNEIETEKVHSTLERKGKTPKRTARPYFGKKRRPKTPEMLKEQSSPIKSTGTLTMTTSDTFHIPGKSMSTLHVCDSPYLLGGCKHTYDPQLESVPPSKRGQSTQRFANLDSYGGKRRRHNLSEPSRIIYDNEVPQNTDFHEGTSVVVRTQYSTADIDTGSSPMLLLTYDNLL